tara:strand:- start:399 stop:857 length:459 start_codon:yes stop_codon:yes gene_type:complete
MFMKLNQEFDFKKYLIDNTSGYNGKYSEYILLLPALYDMLCTILESDELPEKLRADFYLTIGYLIYPNDIYPEEQHGALGFLDDLMLMLVVLRKCAIQEEVGIDFINNFAQNLNYPVEQLLTTDFDKITKQNKVLFDELLAVSGMRFYYKDY